MKNLIVFTTLLSFNITTYCQTTIHGTLTTGRDQPAVGANIYIRNTFEGATSDTAGRFVLKTTLTGPHTLVISYIGYQAHEEAILLDGNDIGMDIIIFEEETQLKEVVIAAGVFEASDEKQSVVLNTLDMSTNANGFGDVYASITALPGISKADDEGGLLVRGGEIYETKTFIDGMLVESPYTAKLPNIPVRGKFSPMLFRGTVFSTGGYSAEYGQALSSALILNSIALPKKDEINLALYSAALDLTLIKKWDKNSISSISDYSNMAPFYKLVNSNIKWEEEPQNFTQTFVFRQKIRENGMLKAMGTFSAEQSSLYYLNMSSLEDELISMKNRNGFIMASYKDIIGSDWLIHAGTSITCEKKITGINLDDMDENLAGNEFKLVLSKQLSESTKIRFGGNVYNKSVDRVYDSEKYDTSFNWNFGNTLSAGFAEADILIGKRTAMRAGARTEHLNLTDETYLSPRMSVAYSLNRAGQLSFSYGSFSQMPEDGYLLYDPGLTSERAEHLILNYQLIRNSRIFRIEGYYKDYNGLVRYDSLYAMDPGSYDNKGSGYARGIDIFYKDTKTIPNGNLWISYSLMDSRRKYRDFPVELTPGFISRHNLSLQYRQYFSSIESYAAINYNFNSGRPYVNPNLGLQRQEYTKSYHNLSLNLFHFTKILGKFTMFHLQVTNLLGADHVFGYRFAGSVDESGLYQAYPVLPVSKRFILFGIYVSFKGKPEF